MLKVSTFRAETDYGISALPLFGPADRAFEKTAAPYLLPDVIRYIERLRPNPHSQYVLVNAMGAGEWFGSNINGDHFPEAALIHAPDSWTGNPLLDKIKSKDWPYGYPTFYGAHPYAHHRNKDASRAFGDVELAVWHPEMRRVELVTRVDKDKCERFGGVGVWDKLHTGLFPDVSMGTRVPFDTCFPAGTLVRTERGHKPIEALCEGDMVLTHTGAIRRVSRTMRRRADGLVRIQASGLPRIETTDNHPFLVLRREQVRTCKGSANGNRLRHSLNDGSCKRCGTAPNFDPVWAAADTVRPGDYLAVPSNQRPVEYDISPAQARLLGYYLGDGYILRQRTGKKKDGEYRDMGFGFSVGVTEEAHLQRLLHTIVEAGAANAPNVYEAGCGRKAFIVSAYDQILSAWLEKWGGRTSHGKRLLDEMFYWSREAKLEVVAGYIDTDGSVDARGQVRITSVNRGLLLDVQRLLLSEGVTATVCFAGSGGGYEGSSDSWYLVLSAAQSQKFLGRSTKISKVDIAWESPQSFFWDGYWFTPVKALEEVEGEVDVFNISVEVDESYVAEGRAVHNCSICLDWDNYRLAQASFEHGRDRHVGEAVLRFHKVKKARDGVGIRGLAITRADYCKHAKEMMNRILPDGRKVFVYNDYPRFFDISFVFIGADKTAKTMLKIAGAGRRIVVPVTLSAKVAEDLGYLEPVEGEKTASDLLQDAFVGKVATDKQSEIVKDVLPQPFASKAVPLLTHHEKDVPDSLVQLLGRAPLDRSLATLGGLGVVLRPREFQRIVLIQLGQASLADELARRKCVFSSCDEEMPWSSGPEDFDMPLARLLLPLLAARSVLGPWIERRVALAVGRGGEEGGKSSSHPSEPLHKIAAAYNSYRRHMLELVAHSQTFLGELASPAHAELAKVAEAQASEVFTPLSVAYIQDAFLDEYGQAPAMKLSQAFASVERVTPSRNTSRATTPWRT